MKNIEATKWEKQRAKGIWRFMLIHGVLLWALPVMIALSLFNDRFKDGFTLTTVMIELVIWFLAGLAFGRIVWFINQQRYKKYLAAQVR